MNLVKLTMTDKNIEDYNNNIKRCIEECPQYFDESKYIKSIDDILPTYESVITDETNKNILSDIKDTLKNFDGVYWCDQLDLYEDFLNEKITSLEWSFDRPFIGYGVSDNASQVIKHFKKLEKKYKIDLGDCVIALRPIAKKWQPKDGGWRWHKWGEYIGVKKPQYEYIYDEDDSINFVWCYELFQVTK
jgi:hypothetical protein